MKNIVKLSVVVFLLLVASGLLQSCSPEKGFVANRMFEPS